MLRAEMPDPILGALPSFQTFLDVLWGYTISGSFALAVMFEFTAFATQTLLYWLISCSKFDNDPVHQ